MVEIAFAGDHGRAGVWKKLTEGLYGSAWLV